ncbi:MAG: hypothetical protein ACYDEY_03945 [Acidimicrobiales bacterium]
MLIKRFGGSCRFVKNLGKEQRDLAWKHGKHNVSSSTMSPTVCNRRRSLHFATTPSMAPG